MKLKTLRISGFQCFGTESIDLSLENITYLIGPNGSGKTAALQALCRLFAVDASQRRILRSDFHVPFNELEAPDERQLWIEADFIFPEVECDDDNSTVAPHFGHMRLDKADGIPRVRYRLEATMGVDGDIEENLVYVLDIDADGAPLSSAQVPRVERNHIHVHYLPARRDPADHIAYSASALLGRILRSVNWDGQREKVTELADQISDVLAANPSIDTINDNLKTAWESLHKGKFFAEPRVTFAASEIEALLKHISVTFSPGHDETLVDFARLSDGQKSMLYLSLVIASQKICHAVLAGENENFDGNKLRPPIFTIVAIEEPENSLSPYYLGRIVKALKEMVAYDDAQTLIATHAPSMLRRVAPEHIRHLRLTEERKSKISPIKLPKKTDVAHKFVREAVQAFPEIYFSRLVILGEGDSEEIVLPRILQAKGVFVDDSAITIAPLGGRHVNHFWRLLSTLEIPYFTLLDLDTARYQGGWGRIKYVNSQLIEFMPVQKLPEDYVIPSWNSDEHKVRDYDNYLTALEEREIYFSYPMDLDFPMILSYPTEYEVDKEIPDDATLKAVLGKKHYDSDQYTRDELDLFKSYHSLFKVGSKPAAHISALARLSDEALLESIPESLDRLADAIINKISELPE